MADTPILGIPQVAPNQNQKETTVNTGFAILEAAMNDSKSHDLTSADLVMTAADFTRYFMHFLTGHTVARTLGIPDTVRWFCVKNEGTATVTVEVDGAGGDTIDVVAGVTCLIVSTGTDVFTVVPDAASGSGVLSNLTDVSNDPPTGGYALIYDDGDSLWKPGAVSMSFTGLNQTPADFSGANRYMVAVNATGDALEFVVRPADVGVFIAGSPEDGEVVARYVPARTFYVSTTGHRASAANAATAETVFSVAKNGVSIGTITFAAAATTGTASITATTFAAGDVLTIEGPGSADASLADISITLAATR